jgi:hypothetical protein
MAKMSDNYLRELVESQIKLVGDQVDLVAKLKAELDAVRNTASSSTLCQLRINLQAAREELMRLTEASLDVVKNSTAQEEECNATLKCYALQRGMPYYEPAPGMEKAGWTPRLAGIYQMFGWKLTGPSFTLPLMMRPVGVTKCSDSTCESVTFCCTYYDQPKSDQPNVQIRSYCAKCCI